MLRVQPEADALGQAIPLFDVAEHALPTLLVKLGDTQLLNLLLAA